MNFEPKSIPKMDFHLDKAKPANPPSPEDQNSKGLPKEKPKLSKISYKLSAKESTKKTNLINKSKKTSTL